MLKQFEDMKASVREDYKDTVQFAGHLFEAIQEYERRHNEEVAQAALNGTERPDGRVEAAIRKTLVDIRLLLIDKVKDTVDDVQHIGDKNHEKHFKDGLR
jgi:predicted PP-loop superfamily ATPase